MKSLEFSLHVRRAVKASTEHMLDIGNFGLLLISKGLKTKSLSGIQIQCSTN